MICFLKICLAAVVMLHSIVPMELIFFLYFLVEIKSTHYFDDFKTAIHALDTLIYLFSITTYNNLSWHADSLADTYIDEKLDLRSSSSNSSILVFKLIQVRGTT